LPISGVQEKVLAAHAMANRHRRNETVDLDDVPAEIRIDEVCFVQTVDDVRMPR
jgi:ATP-dependent Lon protease